MFGDMPPVCLDRGLLMADDSSNIAFGRGRFAGTLGEFVRLRRVQLLGRHPQDFFQAVAFGAFHVRSIV
jgi:hypothetical protein